jgi:hypothetical protein
VEWPEEMARQYPNLAKSPLKLNVLEMRIDAPPNKAGEEGLYRLMKSHVAQRPKMLDLNKNHFPLSKTQAETAKAVVHHYDYQRQQGGEVFRNSDLQLHDKLVQERGENTSTKTKRQESDLLV